MRKPQDASAAAVSGESKSATDKKLDEAQAAQVRKLKAVDASVRMHEQAHAATGGAFAGAPSYSFQRGPDGQNYAVSGEVPIDVSAVAGDPQATIRKMQQVQRAALAPADPSGADRAIAATANAQILAARRELNTQDPQKEDGAGAAAREKLSGLAGAAAYTSKSDVGALLNLVS